MCQTDKSLHGYQAPNFALVVHVTVAHIVMVAGIAGNMDIMDLAYIPIQSLVLIVMIADVRTPHAQTNCQLHKNVLSYLN